MDVNFAYELCNERQKSASYFLSLGKPTAPNLHKLLMAFVVKLFFAERANKTVNFQMPAVMEKGLAHLPPDFWWCVSLQNQPAKFRVYGQTPLLSSKVKFAQFLCVHYSRQFFIFTTEFHLHSKLPIVPALLAVRQHNIYCNCSHTIRRLQREREKHDQRTPFGGTSSWVTWRLCRGQQLLFK